MFKPQNIQSKILLEHLSTPGGVGSQTSLITTQKYKECSIFYLLQNKVFQKHSI